MIIAESGRQNKSARGKEVSQAKGMKYPESHKRQVSEMQFRIVWIV